MEKGNMLITGTVQEVLDHMGSTGVLHVKLAGSDTRAAEILNGAEHVTEVSAREDGTLRALFSGDDEDAAGVLAALVGAGVPVASFHIEKEDIENIFLKLGAREVS